MGGKLLWTSVALLIISAGFAIPAASMVAAVIALIGIILLWMDK